MKENRIVANNGSSIVLYTTENGNTQLEVKLEKDSVWLNREQIAQLYGRDYKTIAKHINNALREELEGESVIAKFATPKKYGRKEGYSQMQNIDYYNLDMIISVGYRVKSRNGIVFRKWANNILKQYLIKGYAIDQRRLDHYDELKDVVRLMSRALTLQDKVSEGEYHALSLVHGEEWHPLFRRRQKTYSRQHPRCFDIDDSRKPNGRERCHGESSGQSNQ